MTRYLLDTHVLLWLLAEPEQLDARLRASLADPQVEVFISAASVWEIAIKRALGRLTAPDDLLEVCDRAGLTPLPIDPGHAWAAGEMPSLHTDPFDRMLVAQAMFEGLSLVTRDSRLRQCNVAVVMA